MKQALYMEELSCSCIGGAAQRIGMDKLCSCMDIV